MQSLFLRSWYTSLKNVSLCHCIRLHFISSKRSTLNQSSRSHFYQSLSKMLNNNVRIERGNVRSFLTHEHVPTQKVARLANKDRIPETYELIYSIPARMGLRLGYFGVVVVSCTIVYASYKTFIEKKDESLDTTLGAFDNESLMALQPEDMPLVIGGLFVALIVFWTLISRMPFRIYRSSSDHHRSYIAVYMNRLVPWDTHCHSFSTARKIPFNFVTRYFFYMESYQLGSRRASLFPTSFRTAYDHDEMIDFQLGKSYFNIKEDNKEFDEKIKEMGLKKKLN